MVLLIDNYDSFVFNLARYLAELKTEVRVVRNDAISLSEIEALQPDAIVLSPGPCTPEASGVCLDVVQKLAGQIPILGVCLGHQAIVTASGGVVGRAPKPVHGQTSLIRHDETSRLFDSIPAVFRATRYHSLLAFEEKLPARLRVTARSSDGLIMALEDAERCVFGVQFHPESILTEHGHRLLANFLRIAGLRDRTSLDELPKSEVCAAIDEPLLATLEESAFRDDPESSPRPLHW